ncbi:MAG: hypothetical protein AB1768_17775 [Pseudomonadota bacterium]
MAETNKKSANMGAFDAVWWSLFEALASLFMVFAWIALVIIVPLSLLMPSGVRRWLRKPRKKGLRVVRGRQRTKAVNDVMRRAFDQLKGGRITKEQAQVRLRRIECWARRKQVPIEDRLYVYKDPSIKIPHSTMLPRSLDEAMSGRAGPRFTKTDE